ncbi:MAG: Maf family protein, partial [Thermodesulfobacteriota bacterium]
EEKYEGNLKPDIFVKRNAKLKANSVIEQAKKHEYILSADTIVVIDDVVLGKPVDPEDAVTMLNLISGRIHKVITGYAITSWDQKIFFSDAITTLVKIKNLTPGEIEGYISTDEPFDNAGSYGIQGIGSFMIHCISGSYTNVVGLPVARVINSLQKLKIINLFEK